MCDVTCREVQVREGVKTDNGFAEAAAHHMWFAPCSIAFCLHNKHTTQHTQHKDTDTHRQQHHFLPSSEVFKPMGGSVKSANVSSGPAAACPNANVSCFPFQHKPFHPSLPGSQVFEAHGCSVKSINDDGTTTWLYDAEQGQHQRALATACTCRDSE